MAVDGVDLVFVVADDLVVHIAGAILTSSPSSPSPLCVCVCAFTVCSATIKRPVPVLFVEWNGMG